MSVGHEREGQRGDAEHDGDVEADNLRVGGDGRDERAEAEDEADVADIGADDVADADVALSGEGSAEADHQFG